MRGLELDSLDAILTRPRKIKNQPKKAKLLIFSETFQYWSLPNRNQGYIAW